MDSTGAEGLELSMSPPVHQTSGMIIGGSGAIRYGDQGYIEFFSQHYLHVVRPTEPNWFYGSENSAPAEMTGWIPDALIPSDALAGKGRISTDHTANGRGDLQASEYSGNITQKSQSEPGILD